VNAPTHCVHHPAVLGIALCVRCREALCGACTTRIQGRNLCAACVAQSLDTEDAVVSVSALGVTGVYFAVASGAAIIVGVLTGLGVALHALG